MRPEVSILIPLYNSAATIERAIKSAQLQTLRHLEILVADDASTDDGAARVAAIAREDNRIRLLRLPENVLHASLLDSAVPGRYHPAFRYCRQCAAHGYHSVLYQLNDEDRCPAHRQSLETRCLHCGEETPYVVNTSLVEAPFRCVSCHSHFSYGRLSLLSTTPAMRRRDRAAISHRLRVRSDDNMDVPRPEQRPRSPADDLRAMRR